MDRLRRLCVLVAGGSLAFVLGAAAGAAARADPVPLEAPPVALPEPAPDLRLVSQAEWAARLVEALGLGPVLPAEHGPDDLFALLCPDQAELALGPGGERTPVRPPLRAVARDLRTGPGSPRTLSIRLVAPATALYVLRVRGRGLQRWWLDRLSLGALDPDGLGEDWAGRLLPLAAGAHRLVVALAPGASVAAVELDAFRALCIAPATGWHASRPLRFADKARTLARLLAIEDRLPPAGEPILREGEDFDAESGAATRAPARSPLSLSGGAWALARGGVARFVYRFALARPGIYTLSARVHGRAPQLWELDGRYAWLLRPSPRAARLTWEAVTTRPLGAGEHTLRVTLAAGSGLDLLRLRRHRGRGADYVRLLTELGLREGAPDEPVRVAAAEANLESPVLRTQVAGFLRRFDGPRYRALAEIEREMVRRYDRPLSPLLPPEL